MTYSEKLKDPNWQRKRLEILQRDNFRCRACESKTKTLHVHHSYYIKNRDPWDYDDNVLLTLCEDCHSKVNGILWQKAFMDLNLCPGDLLDMAGWFGFLFSKRKERQEQEGSKYAFNPSINYSDIFLSEISEEELHEYYNEFKPVLKSRYSNG